jgi:hypothetical protein
MDEFDLVEPVDRFGKRVVMVVASIAPGGSLPDSDKRSP